MAAITTAADGNWSATGTWTGGVVPGAGDTTTLNHNVTVDVAITVGASDIPTTGVPAIAWGTADKILTINANLTLRGDITPASGTGVFVIVQAAGTTVEFDASLAASPSTTHYAARSVTSQRWGWRMNGTLSSPCAVQSNTGGGYAWFDPNGDVWALYIHATYTRFFRLGAGDVKWYDFSLNAAVTAELYLDHCIVDTCGPMSAFGANSTCVFNLTNSVWKNSTGTNTGNFGATIVSLNTAEGLEVGVTKIIKNNYVDGMYWAGSSGYESFTIEDNVFAGGVATGTMIAGAASFKNTLVVFTSNTAGCFGNTERLYYLCIDTAESNPHGPGFNTIGHYIKDSCFETAWASGAGGGDLVFYPDGLTSVQSYSFTGNILVPQSDGHSPGKFLSVLTSDKNIRMQVEHNTAVADGALVTEAGMVQYGESGNGVRGQTTSLKSNLCWSATAANAQALSRLQGAVQDEVDAGNTDFNAFWNPRSTGLDRAGYTSETTGSPFSHGPPGGHDVIVTSNPFVDSTRNFRSWGGSLGFTASNAATLTAMLLRLDWSSGSYAPSNGATPTALVTWVRAGFAVADGKLALAAHDGGTIGAMPFVASAPYIKQQPASQAVVSGNKAYLSVVAVPGSGSLSYQWQLNTGSGYANISGATAASYVSPVLTTANTGNQYRCNVTDSGGTTTSSGATVTVQTALVGKLGEFDSMLRVAGWF
jgi:hypothetical protein